jgi:hypothetical protein
MSLRIRDESGVEARREFPEGTEAHDMSPSEVATTLAMTTIDRICMSEF